MKKSRRVLLALACLLATVLLTVGCTATGSQIPEETPAPDSASDASSAPATEPQQTETEFPTETEPVAQSTEPPAPVAPFYDVNKQGFISNSQHVAVNERIYYVMADGIYEMYEGQEHLLYSGSFLRYWLCTDGTLLYAVDQAGDVLQLNIADRSIKTLFNVGPTADILGASEELLYIGHQEDENDWWGYDLCVYTPDGVLQEKLGEDLGVHMEDGILCCYAFHSDMRTVPFQAYDRSGTLIVDAEEMWSHSVQNGAVYYLAVDDGYTIANYDPDCTTSIYRVDANGTTVISTFDGDPYGRFCADTILVNGELYSLETGKALPHNLTKSLFDVSSNSYNRNAGKDQAGKWYSYDTREYTFWRENADGELVECGKLPASTSFVSIYGDWVYSQSYSGDRQMYGTYLPVS